MEEERVGSIREVYHERRKMEGGGSEGESFSKYVRSRNVVLHSLV